MKHRLIGFIALAALACAVVAAGASGGGKGRLFQFRGELLATSATSVQVQVEGGNHAALHALIGQSQNQTFTIDSKTEILVWTDGVPHVGSIADLKVGDSVQVSIARRTARRSPISRRSPPRSSATTATTPAATAARCSSTSARWPAPRPAATSRCTSPAATGAALRSLLGQSLDQTFTYDDGTIFLLWQGKVPTVIDPSQLKAGDRITVRVRAARARRSQQVEAIAAAHVGDHEPATR